MRERENDDPTKYAYSFQLLLQRIDILMIYVYIAFINMFTVYLNNRKLQCQATVDIDEY